MPFVVLQVVAVNGLEAALAEGNTLSYGLSAGIYTNVEDELRQFLESAEAGVLYANRASGVATGACRAASRPAAGRAPGSAARAGLALAPAAVHA